MSDEKNSKEFEKVKQIIQDIGLAMMVTADKELNMRARPMQTQDVDHKNNIWFFTNENSAKIKEVAENRNVTLTYASKSDSSFLSITGKASFSDDHQRKKDLFGPMAKAWFPDGVDDPNLLLMKIDPEHAEYWNSSSSGLVQIFRIAKAIASNEVYEGGENKKLDL